MAANEDATIGSTNSGVLDQMKYCDKAMNEITHGESIQINDGHGAAQRERTIEEFLSNVELGRRRYDEGRCRPICFL